jgi:hypothetical protein
MKAQSKIGIRNWLFLLGIGIVLLASIAGAISNSNYTDTVYRVLHSHQPIRKIELRIITGEDSNFDRTILDRIALLKFGAALRGGEKITRDVPGMHTAYIDMDIFKDRKINISLLKSVDSGWIIAAGKDWYKNDSLVQLLTPYLSPNAH